VELTRDDGYTVSDAIDRIDRATFAWLCDVFVDEAHRGRGVGAFMVHATVEHPDVVDVGRHVLISSTAQPLYARFGYEPLGDEAALWMARVRPA
jgi:GNAT superfamily N-acetyltransferase